MSSPAGVSTHLISIRRRHQQRCSVAGMADHIWDFQLSRCRFHTYARAGLSYVWARAFTRGRRRQDKNSIENPAKEANGFQIELLRGLVAFHSSIVYLSYLLWYLESTPACDGFSLSEEHPGIILMPMILINEDGLIIAWTLVLRPDYCEVWTPTSRAAACRCIQLWPDILMRDGIQVQLDFEWNYRVHRLAS